MWNTSILQTFNLAKMCHPCQLGNSLVVCFILNKTCCFASNLTQNVLKEVKATLTLSSILLAAKKK